MFRAVVSRKVVYDNRVLPACTLTFKRFANQNVFNDDTQKPKPIAQKVEKIKKYWFFRFVDYIENYDTTLEKTFPRMMHVYRLISMGTKDLYVDLKKFIAIKKKETLHGIDSLSRDELQLNYNMPRDIAKITPVLLILAVPFTNYILFPVAYFFPRKVLTSHYWTPEQKDQFLAIDHKSRQKYMRRVLITLEQHGKNIVPSEMKDCWRKLVSVLRNHRDPKVYQVLDCKPLFESGPFSLENIKRGHVRELMLIHGISTWTFQRRKALEERGILIKKMDIAIMKEGGASKMDPNALKIVIIVANILHSASTYLLFVEPEIFTHFWFLSDWSKITLSFRGIDPTGMSTQGMENWMDKWLQISNEIDDKSLSLLLHCPVLLSYNWNIT